MEELKYKLTEETIVVYNKTLYRIEALKDFGDVKKGDKGGYVENEDNLSQYDNCWIYGVAKVYDDAKVCDNAIVRDNAEISGGAGVFGNAEVSDNAKVYECAWIYDKVHVCDDAVVCDDAEVFGNARICGNATIASSSDYIVFKNWWSSGRYFTWTRSNDMWKVGCFYGTGKELIEKAYRDSEVSGREYERIVKYVESIIGK